MKIAVFSLLRMGDCLQHLKLYQAYQQSKNLQPTEILWIIDESSKPFAKLLPENTRVLLFPRKQLQDILVLQLCSPLRAAQALEDWCKQIGPVDALLNFTHTRLAYKLAGFTSAPLRVGFDLNNPYLHYLNSIAQTNELPILPYFQLQALSLDLQLNLQAARWPLRPQRIAVHCLTSDAEKNWSFENWRILFRLLQRQDPNLEITLIGAPSDQKILQSEFAHYDLKYFCQDLPKTREHLQRTDLLIAMDSAMLHLAALDNIPSLGVFCGPARAQKISPISLSCEIVQCQSGLAPSPEEVFEILRLKALDLPTPTLNLKQMAKNWSLLWEKLEYNKEKPAVEFL
jgi:ADP-heptose:LPS heptosyltransferase